MAIVPTGAIYKSLVFDGESSRDYGIYITGQAVYNAPERDVEMINIPGRNGSFALDKGRFQNIEVAYPAGIFADNEADFAQGISDFRNFLCSRNGYVRLTDEYNPDEYRMAVYKSGLDVSPAQLRAGEFQIVFDCKPQRYLTSGEEPITIGEYAEVAGTDNEPYLFRASPQFSNEYDTEIDKIVGGTVAWNQLGKKATNTQTSSQVTFTPDGNGGIDVNGTATGGNASYSSFSQNVDIIKDHKYIVVGCPKNGDALTYSIVMSTYAVTGNPREIGNGIMFKGLSNGTTNATLIVIEGTTVNHILFRPQVFDLTQMFGSTIADHIYSLETANTGAGVAWFKKLFNKPYYAYNAGELMSVQASSHDMVGFNAWDETYTANKMVSSNDGTLSSRGSTENLFGATDYIKVVPSTAYYFKIKGLASGSYGCAWYDADKNFISGNAFSGYTVNDVGVINSPRNACYLRATINMPDADTTNINLSWDGERDGEYEAYVKHSYPLDSSLTLRGIPKIDANNNLYYDGDTYESDGTVTRKYGIVDLGSLTWQHISDNSYFRATLSGAYYADAVTSICSKYRVITNSQRYIDKTLFINSNPFVIIKDSDAGTDATAFKTAMSGVYLVYELATPTTETADPYINPQIVDRYGTEEYVTTSIVPIGHDTRYGEDPNVLVNPTLFESSPMLEVEGYGNIQFNGYEIELTNDVIGDVLLLGATNDKTYIYYDGSLVNTNDVVTIHDHRNLRFRTNVTTASYTPTSATLTRTTSNIPGTFSYTATLDGRNFVLDLSYSGSDTFSYGTTSSKQDTFTLNIGYTDGNTSGTLTRTFNVTQRATSRYVHTYSTEDTSGGIQIYGSRCSYGEITAYSTQTILGHPTYVECDIGVCYKEVDGEAVSLNQYIDLGSDLPKLASGANTITADNTVTDLKIIPRWWRI